MWSTLLIVGAVRYETTDPNVFLSNLTTIGTQPPVSSACTDDDIAGITAALGATVIYNKSPIFLLTDVAPNDTANWMDVYQPNSFRKLPIYTIFLNNNGQCQNEALARGYMALQDISLTSGGLFFAVNNGSYVNTFQQVMRRVTYFANYVTMNEMSRCIFRNYGSFIIDPSAVTITILTTGSKFRVESAEIF